VWLGASYALGRPVPVTEPYPHICGTNVVGRETGRRYRLWRRDCAACIQDEHDERQQTDDYPPVDPDITAAEARRLGEHD
jgi:hypothetical protein